MFRGLTGPVWDAILTPHEPPDAARRLEEHETFTFNHTHTHTHTAREPTTTFENIYIRNTYLTCSGNTLFTHMKGELPEIYFGM